MASSDTNVLEKEKELNSNRVALGHKHGARHGDEDDTSKYRKDSLNSRRFVLIIFPISDY